MSKQASPEPVYSAVTLLPVVSQHCIPGNPVGVHPQSHKTSLDVFATTITLKKLLKHLIEKALSFKKTGFKLHHCNRNYG